MIQKIDLSGEWGFRLDEEKAGIERKYFREELEDTIYLPGTTSEQKKGAKSEKKELWYLTEPYHFEGYAWYAKEVELDPQYADKIILLNLERTRISNVWINGTFVGSQESFSTCHQYDISDYLKAGKNQLTIMVSNADYKTPGGHMTSPDTQTNWNGIVGELSIYIYENVWIQNVQAFPNLENKRIEIALELACKNQSEEIELELLCHKKNAGSKEETILRRVESVSLSKGVHKGTYDLFLDVDKTIEPWNEYSPVLYEVEVNVKAENSTDTKSVTIGFRDLHTKERTFLLNDLPIMLRGKHDGMIFPLTGYAPMNKEDWVKTFRIAKEYGINHYRFHTCCPPEAAFEAADEEGMYLEPELPFWGTVYRPDEEEYNEEQQAFLLQEGFDILKAFGNHPSFLMFSLGNELWGSHEIINDMLRKFKEKDKRHWYTQGSNNFQFVPVILSDDDFFSGVRFSKERLFRGSYAMCDAPQGHVQINEPENEHNYDEIICPKEAKGTKQQSGEIQIQYKTGTKTVKAEEAEELISHIPVVSHEVGQYETYPDFREIEKFTGVVKAENLEIFKERAKERGILPYAEKFFEASGKLAVACYKRELETAFRSKELAGFQLLDIQDFTGQGMAYVGILNAFMENKGLVTAKDWRAFCSDRVLMLSFPRFVYEAGEQFSYEILFSNMNPEQMDIGCVKVTLYNEDKKVILEKTCEPGGTGLTRLVSLGHGSFSIPNVKNPEKLLLTVEAEHMNRKNEYAIYVYPEITREAIWSKGFQNIVVTEDKSEMLAAAQAGKKVLFIGSKLREEKSILGTYCTDFWCYPMFASISESVNKPKPIGTMGMYIEKEHKALETFKTDEHTTPQWWKIITDAKLAVLDDTELTPIVWMIDNFDRSHKIGVVFEAKVGTGNVLICQPNLLKGESLEENWLLYSLLSYVDSDAFKPTEDLTLAQIDALYE